MRPTLPFRVALGCRMVGPPKLELENKSLLKAADRGCIELVFEPKFIAEK